METSILNEWLALQRSIRGRFQSLADVDHRGLTERLQYAVFPSFADFRCLNILAPTRGGDPLAYRTTWKYDRDLAAFSTPIERLQHPTPFKPTIETELLAVAPDSLDAIVATLEEVSLPLHAGDHSCGLDGTSYELQLGSNFGWCRIEWWATIPKQWQAISPVVKTLDAIIQSPPVGESTG